jgi:hypothetical protein
MHDFVQRVHDELLNEARRSPELFRDLAKLESYVAETYSARAIIELLQNADDAAAGRFCAVLTEAHLVCANDGRVFSEPDFYALCRSARSEKTRGESIGYRGIGFKSVVRISQEVHLLSGDIAATFSRELTERALGLDTPTPLVRIPHKLQLAAEGELGRCLDALRADGFSTIFVFAGVDRDAVSEEMAEFDAEYLLFLRHITDARLSARPTDAPRLFACSRTVSSGGRSNVQICAPDRRSDWEVYSYSECDLAFAVQDGVPVALREQDAVVHAFLPTLETTGMGVRVNADFSTDPSRTRVIHDTSTHDCVARLADVIATHLAAGLTGQDAAAVRMLPALVPTIDLATVSLQRKSLKTALVEAVREMVGPRIRDLFLAPRWLNSTDADAIAVSLGKGLAHTDGPMLAERLSEFLRYVGVPVLSLDLVCSAIANASLTERGRTEIAAQLIRGAAAGRLAREAGTVPIWSGEAGTAGLESLSKRSQTVARDFVSKLEALGIRDNELRLFAVAVLGTIKGPGVFGLAPELSEPEADPKRDIAAAVRVPFDPLSPSGTDPSREAPSDAGSPTRFLPAWRSAEQSVAEMLRGFGYTVDDRSRQNLGYDIYAVKGPRKYYVEVKLIDFPGQPFSVTSNEESVARECGESYVVALVLRRSERLDVQFVHNPIERLQFVRQCRQWVWECSEYTFEPGASMRFA